MGDASFEDLDGVLCGRRSGLLASACCLDGARLVRPKPSVVLGNNSASRHPQCYARALGGCSDKISKEHTESEVILKKIASSDPEGRLIARGIKRLKHDERVLHPASLTAKILCEHHNNILSPFDAAGGRFFDALADADERGAPDIPRVTFVSGYDVEKWMLKVFCGNVSTGDYTDASGLMKPGEVPLPWLEVLYGRAAWPTGWGLYFTGTAGDEADQGSLHLRTHLVVDGRLNTPIGLRFAAAGFAFSFLVVDSYPELRIQSRQYRPGRINLRFPTDTPETVLGMSWWPSHVGTTVTVGVSRYLR